MNAFVLFFLASITFLSHPIGVAAGGTDAASFLTKCLEMKAEEGEQGDYLTLTYRNNPNEEFRNVPENAPKVGIHIFDVPVSLHADIVDAVEAIYTSPTTNILVNQKESMPTANKIIQNGRQVCQLSQFQKGQHHSTHMAGIIASQDNKFGFIGINPLARIYSYSREGFSDKSLIDLIMALQDSGGPLKVFLLATKFEYSANAVDGSYLRLNPLQDPADMHAVTRAIKASSNLVFVAATGDGEGGRPKYFKKESALTPMNMGYLPNVIVVTACSNCTSTSAKIMDDANFSNDLQLIHVAAPGEGISGLTDGLKYGLASGTSQAAAFVAGVVTSMIQKYPTYYTNPSRVKGRLLISSSPNIIDYRDRGVAGGVVDHSLALLDPEKTWLRTVTDTPEIGSHREDHSGYHEVKIRHWCEELIRLSDPATGKRNKDLTVEATSILRIRRLERIWEENPVPQWSIWYSTEQANLRMVQRTPPGIWTERDGVSRLGDPIAKLQDGTLIKLGELQDLMLAHESGNVPSGSCR